MTATLILSKQPDAYNLQEEEISIYISEVIKHEASQLLTDYAQALVERFNPSYYLDVEFLFQPQVETGIWLTQVHYCCT